MEFANGRFVRIGPLSVWRSYGGNRLVAGTTAEEAPDWEEGLKALDFQRVPSRNGHAAGAPVYWVLRKHDAFTPSGILHTEFVLDRLHQFLSARGAPSS